MSPRYTPLSHADSDEESSHLLSISSINSRHNDSPSTCSATLNPALVLRLASLVMGILAFIIFIVDGDTPFIAADIFLAFIMILDFSMIFHHAISDVFQITIHLRNGSWKGDVRGSEKLDAVWYIDILLSTCLLISLIVGNVLHWPGIWIVAVIFGYFIIIIHILLAIPVIHKNSFTLTISAKLNRSGEKRTEESRALNRPSARNSGSDAGSDGGLARRATADAEESRQPVEDLV
ncbi:hypothetical protein N431DRAFT_557547 [Stipitochalara longipes BDJ]|nr:hypothetical protein N431DRAFT_557547 [Stipitochalara longipes BDJ]